MNTNSKVKSLVRISLFAALISASGYISIPIPPVPITAQTLVVMLSGCVLTPMQAAASVLTFMLLGAIGLPVFSGGTAGLQIILGPTGGYLFGFLIGAVIISLLKGNGRQFARLLLACMMGGILTVYMLGVLWLSFSTGMSLGAAFMAGALLFIPGDIIKVLLAAFMAQQLNKGSALR